jgi:hypothetical protein
MKTLTKLIAIAGLPLAIGLAGCSKDKNYSRNLEQTNSYTAKSNSVNLQDVYATAPMEHTYANKDEDEQTNIMTNDKNLNEILENAERSFEKSAEKYKRNVYNNDNWNLPTTSDVKALYFIQEALYYQNKAIIKLLKENGK